MRKFISLIEGWQFYKTEPTDSTGEAVTLPHTWNAVDGQDGGNDYHRGTCWYVQNLPCPQLEDGERVWLQCKGAAMTAEVYVNGEKLARHGSFG